MGIFQSAPTIDADKLDKRLKEIMDELKILGLSAAIVNKDGSLWEGHYGLASIEGSKKMDAHSIYRIASISKSILATALMQLYDQEKFQLDDDISDYLGFKVRNPHYPDKKITFKHLQTHTSSLQDVYVDFVRASYCDDPPALTEILLPGGKFYTDGVWGNYEPGDQDHFLYSNLGSVVVGTLIEKISGERFDAYCKRRIFIPLRMNETSHNIEEINIPKIAVLYNYDPKTSEYNVSLDSAGKDRPPKIDLTRYTPGKNGGIFSPQGGVRTNASDLTKFLLAHMNGGILNGVRILKEETVKLMHSELWHGTPKYSRYRKKGLHFQISDDLLPGKTLIGHSGDAYGMISGLYFDKDYERGILFMTNGSNVDPNQQTYTIETKLTEALYNAV